MAAHAQEVAEPIPTLAEQKEMVPPVDCAAHFYLMTRNCLKRLMS